MAFKIATIGLENGARIGICALPGMSGHFDADMMELLAWRPDAVVTMTGQLEMQRGGATDMPARLADADIAWRHFPIVDFGAPTLTESAWPVLSSELHAVLDKGGSVLTHCYGGHGRAGMITLRLLTERGEDPEKALARIRAVRPGAVEAASQYQWAAAGAGTRGSRGVTGSW